MYLSFLPFLNIPDPLLAVIANLTIWSTIEPACSVIAACLPTLGPLGQKGRNPESLVASVRSVLSLRSYNTSIRTEKHGNGSLDNSKCSRSLEGDEEARGGWAKNSGTGSTTVESGMNIRSAPKSVEIVMEKGFSSE